MKILLPFSRKMIGFILVAFYTTNVFAFICEVGTVWSPDLGKCIFSCSSDLNCSLAGTCLPGGKCACKSWWKGERCQLLNFKPAKSIWQGVHRVNTSTWGSGVLFDTTDGLYHAVTAEMANACGIKSWQRNSFCAHYSAKSPLGPFERKGIVEGVWCHNPTLTQDPTDGSWLMWHVGNGKPPSKPMFTNCSGGHTLGPTLTSQNDQDISLNPRAAMESVLVSKTPYGPWKDVSVQLLNAAGQPTGPFSNPAPLPPHNLVQLNGSMLVMFAARKRYNASCPSSQLGIARGITWKGPLKLDPKPVYSGPRTLCEDPFIWMDSDRTYHSLCNSKDMGELGNGFGMHAFSHDAVNWFWDDEPAYNTTVELVNGTNIQLGRRERPHILFDAKGIPTHLYAAVTLKNDGDRCHTFVQEFK